MEQNSGKMAHTPILLFIFLIILPSTSRAGFSASNFYELRDCVLHCLASRIKQRNECSKRCVCCLPGSEVFLRCKNFLSTTTQSYEETKINNQNSIEETYEICTMK